MNYSEEASNNNIRYLAKFLALNHFNASTVDLFSKRSNQKEPVNEKDKENILSKIDELLNKVVFKDNLTKKDIKHILDVQGNGYIIKDQNKEEEGEEKEDNKPIIRLEESQNDKSNHPSRNILVIGAGATFNAFENIPLAEHVIDLLKKKIMIGSADKIKKKSDKIEGSENSTEKTKEYISLDYLIRFCEVYDEIPDKGSDKKLDNNYFKSKDDQLGEEHFNEFLWDQVQNKNIINALPELARKFNNEVSKFNQLKGEYGSKQLEFETFLNNLAKIFTVEKVREAVQKIYDFKEGTTLFYSIVAHLFKHRFIDIIINFNFDELLDTALEEELGERGFDKILSDGDCRTIKELAPEGKLLQPLYIKPHGTASHKSTLRFTKEHYHELPSDIKHLITDLIKNKEELNKNRTINLITAGFGMASIEFNDILVRDSNRSDNNKYNIFALLYHKPRIDSEKLEASIFKKVENYFKIFKGSKNPPNIYPIAHNLYADDSNDNETITLEPIECKQCYCSLGNTALILFREIQSYFNELYKPRDIDRHLLINHFFGNRTFWNIALEEEMDCEEGCKDKSDNLSYYPKTYFSSADYFKDRIIIEAFANFSINVGKIDPMLFMNGRAGYFYSKYYEKIKEANSEQPIALIKLLDILKIGNTKTGNKNALGVRLIESLPKEKPKANPFKAFEFYFQQFFENVTGRTDPQETLILSKKMKEYINDGINKSETSKQLLKKLFWKLIFSDNSKIQPEFRNHYYHVFENYQYSDLITTNLMHDLHFYLGLELDKSKDEQKVNCICAVIDNGYQLARFLPFILQTKKSKQFKIYLILQDHFNGRKKYEYQRKNALKTIVTASKNWEIDENGNIKEDSSKERDKIFQEIEEEGFIEIMFLPIGDHNRHMTIFMELNEDELKSPVLKNPVENIKRAIYFYKKGLSREINPISIWDNTNHGHLWEIFKAYSLKAIEYRKKLYDSNLEWITNGNQNK
jgi:hypothetical protein